MLQWHGQHDILKILHLYLECLFSSRLIQQCLREDCNCATNVTPSYVHKTAIKCDITTAIECDITTAIQCDITTVIKCDI